MYDYNSFRTSEPIDKRYYCQMCQSIYNDVHQSECGCRYCSTCIDQIFLANTPCGICHIQLHEKIKIRDKAFKRELDNYLVGCVECRWKGCLSDYVKHFIESHNGPLSCKYCKAQLQDVNELETHLKEREKIGKCEFKCLYHEIGCKKVFADYQSLIEHEQNDNPTHTRLIYLNIKRTGSNGMSHMYQRSQMNFTAPNHSTPTKRPATDDSNKASEIPMKKVLEPELKLSVEESNQEDTSEQMTVDELLSNNDWLQNFLTTKP